MNNEHEHETFLKTANLDLIGAIQSVCRTKYENTVKTLDSLSDLKLEAVKNGGLLSLSKEKINTLRRSMKTDNFCWNIAEQN